MDSVALAAGFADPVIESQGVFRAVMDALARPGTPMPLSAALAPPAPLTPGLAAVALTLADHEAPLWLDPPLAEAPAVAAPPAAQPAPAPRKPRSDAPDGGSSGPAEAAE